MYHLLNSHTGASEPITLAFAYIHMQHIERSTGALSTVGSYAPFSVIHDWTKIQTNKQCFMPIQC